MVRKICPYLGLPDDEKTSMAFPSEGNFCHKAYPAGPVRREHQAGYCLTEQHADCPVFLARRAARLPVAIAEPSSRWERTRKKLGTAIFLMVALFFSLAGNWVSSSRVAARTMSLTNPPYLFELKQANITSDRSEEPPSPLPTQPHFIDTLFASPEPEPTDARECLLRKGWEVYTVQPTDSIIRISTLYGVSVEVLQKSNCMGSETFLAPGSTLYVPARNPTATSTATNPPPMPTPLPVIVNDNSGDDNSASEDDKPTLNQPTPEPTEGETGREDKRDEDDDGDDHGKGDGDNGDDDDDHGKGDGKNNDNDKDDDGNDDDGGGDDD